MEDIIEKSLCKQLSMKYLEKKRKTEMVKVT